MLFISGYDNIYKYDTTGVIKQDWIFPGKKKRDIAFDDIVHNAVIKIPHWLTLPEKNGMFFGAQAFRAWADNIENGRYEDNPDLWSDYGVYFCNMATNAMANNLDDVPSVVNHFAQANPQYTDMKNKIAEQYFNMGNGDGAGGIWKALEDLGGGFNVTREALQDKEKRVKIAAKIREAADYLHSGENFFTFNTS